MANQEASVAPHTASTAIASAKRNVEPEEKPTSEAKPKTVEKTSVRHDVAATANAAVPSAKDVINSTTVAGNKRKLETAEDPKASADSEAKKRRLSGTPQLCQVERQRATTFTGKPQGQRGAACIAQ